MSIDDLGGYKKEKQILSLHVLTTEISLTFLR